MTEYKIITDGNDIIAIEENGELLSKEEADQIWVWMMTYCNTCQYPGDGENDN